MEIRKAYSIGFTKRTAEGFFESLKKAGIKQLIDIRLNNVSQLAGFTKQEDLKYLLKTICGILASQGDTFKVSPFLSRPLPITPSRFHPPQHEHK